MTESTPEPTPDTVVEGDAVINNAPDGGGVDNEAPAESEAPAEPAEPEGDTGTE